MANIITSDIIPMNRTEHGYAALEGLAGTMLLPSLMRLSAPVTEEQVKLALRKLVTAYPKLRSIVEPGLRLYHFRVLPDGPLMDQMVDRAFHVDRHINIDDPAELEAWHRSVVNDIVPLEHGPCYMVRFVPHPERPAIIFAVPHILVDGLSVAFLVHNIIRSLNGMDIEPMPVEAPSMVGAIAPEKWWQWPVQMWKSRQHQIAEKKRLAEVNVLQVPTRLGPHYTSSGFRHHEVSIGTDEMRKATKKVGVSLNALVVSAFAQTFLDQSPDDPKGAAVIRISVDLRRFYPKDAKHGMLLGNHVGASLVIEQNARKTARERLQSVDAQLKEGIARYTRREMCWGYLLEELMPYLGRTAIAHFASQMKRKNKFPKISAHVTTGGNVNMINVWDKPIRIVQLYSTVNSISPLSSTLEIDGKYYTPLSWQLSETSNEEMADFQRRLDATLVRLVREVLAEDAPVAASSTVAA
ncbi:MAG: hypothetical protein QM742_16280 [Aquabacterium sp.]